MGATSRFFDADLLIGRLSTEIRLWHSRRNVMFIRFTALIGSVFLTLNAYAVDLLLGYQQALSSDAVQAGVRQSPAQTRSIRAETHVAAVAGRHNGHDTTDQPHTGLSDSSSNYYRLSLSQPLVGVAAWQN